MKANGNKSEISLKVYAYEDLLRIFPFGKTKLRQLLKAGILPVVKIGRDYLTCDRMIEAWLSENIGKELFY